jgi:polyhydroxyalkanoate synthase subunit PhaC
MKGAMAGVADAMAGPLDVQARGLGWMMDAAGLGPIPMPHRVVWSVPGLELRAVGPATASGPALLIVPAPIKRSYIWDLCPGHSAVGRCVKAGLRVYLVHWMPTRQRLGLADCAGGLLLGCLERIELETGQRQVALAGHSLGGTLVAIFASLEPNRVSRLLLIDAPLCFGPGSGDLARLVKAGLRVGPLARMSGNIPGSLLDLAATRASPLEYVWRPLQDWLLSLADPEALQLHLRVRRWTRDQLAMPAALFEQIVEWLYREDRFIRGRLWLGGRLASPGDVKAALMIVVDEDSPVVPAGAYLRFCQLAGTADLRIITYRPDVGVALAHVGALVGGRAHRRLWPVIAGWLLGN